MQKVTLQKNGDILLPKRIINNLELYVGQSFRVIQDGNRIILEPVMLLAEQLKKDLQQGLEDIKKGKFIEFASIEEFNEKMKRYEN